MSKHDDGGPAFPVAFHSGQPLKGMTLEDWFAGMAQMGILANPAVENADPESVSRWSYDHAAAMVAEREKRRGG